MDVAGKADILVVPDLEAGNMLAKQPTFLASAVTVLMTRAQQAALAIAVMVAV